jgi:hypothetical protein
MSTRHPDPDPLEWVQHPDPVYGRWEPKTESHILGFLRWRGAWNWKDITERVIAGFIAGLSAGLGFWLMERVFG